MCVNMLVHFHQLLLQVLFCFVLRESLGVEWWHSFLVMGLVSKDYCILSIVLKGRNLSAIINCSHSIITVLSLLFNFNSY